jgi:hypothetical protein
MRAAARWLTGSGELPAARGEEIEMHDPVR